MKSILVVIWLIAIAGYGADSISADAGDQRCDLQQAFMVPKDNPNMMEAFYRGDHMRDEKMSACIRDAIAINNDAINRQMITYLYWKVFPSFDNRTRDGSERRTLPPLDSAEELKPFLLERLHDNKPHYRLYEVIMVLYRNDKNVVSNLIANGRQSDQVMGSVINACLSAGIYNDDADDLAVLAISSEYATVSSVAASYLQRRPLKAALPHLVWQLHRLDSEVDFSLAQSMADYFYVEPETSKLIETAFDDNKIKQYIDDWRVKILDAIMRCEPIEISHYAPSIISVKHIVTTGLSSARSYDRLIRLIETVKGSRKREK